MPYTELAAFVVLVALFSGLFENDGRILTEPGTPVAETVVMLDTPNALPLAQ
jgi:hypothetical protein